MNRESRGRGAVPGGVALAQMGDSCQENLARVTREYFRDGFAYVPQLFDMDTVLRVREELARYTRDVLPLLPSDQFVLEEGGQVVRNLWHLQRRSQFFRDLAARPEVLDLVRDLVRGVPEIYQVETFNKPACWGSAVPAHQDNSYFWQTPPDMLTVWVAIERAARGAGAMWYLPGSHDRMLPARRTGVAGNSVGLDAPEPGTALVWAEAAPGDAWIHHCQTVHGSEPNTTNESRCALLMVYRASHTQTDPELKGLYDEVRTTDGLPIVG